MTVVGLLKQEVTLRKPPMVISSPFCQLSYTFTVLQCSLMFLHMLLMVSSYHTLPSVVLPDRLVILADNRHQPSERILCSLQARDQRPTTQLLIHPPLDISHTRHYSPSHLCYPLLTKSLVTPALPHHDFQNISHH